MIELILAVAACYSLYCYFAINRFSRPHGDTTSSKAIVQADSRINKRHVPEDAVLKRHFTTHLRGEIEAGLPPRPTDSILQRHHETLIMVELDRRLMELGRLTPC